MATKRRVAQIGARVSGGLLGMAVVVVAIGGAAVVPWPTLVQPAPSTLVTPVADSQLRVCPGPLLTLAEDSSQAETATSVGRYDTVYSARTAVTGAEAVPVDRADLAAVDNSQAARDGAPLVLSVPVEAGADAAPMVAAAQSQAFGIETIGGFAVSACTAASSDSWLVSGSTDVGRTSLVLLGNPTDVVASVDLTVYGEAGVVDAPGSTGILVQPGSQRIVSLAGLAPNLRSPVVHVQSTGGQVAAAMEQSVIRGLQPGGVELSGPSTMPATEQVIPGVAVSAPSADASADAGAVTEDTPTVRVLVPGDTPAQVTVGVQSEDGSATGTSLEVEIPAGVATEVPLSGIGPGTFTVKLTADQPVVSAALTSTPGSVNPDFSWSSAAQAQTGAFAVSVPPGPAPTIHLANTDAVDANLTFQPDAGDAIVITVPAGQSAVVPLAGSTNYLVSGGTSIAAAVAFAGDGQASSFTLSPIGVLSSAITVYSH